VAHWACGGLIQVVALASLRLDSVDRLIDFPNLQLK
jgi:hypothetical protein